MASASTAANSRQLETGQLPSREYSDVRTLSRPRVVRSVACTHAVRIGAALPRTRHVVSWADGRELYKTDELIELPFGGTDSFGSKEPLDGAHIPDGRYTFDGDMRRSIVKYKLRYCTVRCMSVRWR